MKILDIFLKFFGNFGEIGYVFKVSDDTVYARGLLKVQVSEKVKFEKEGESIYGIVNYLDNVGVVKNKTKRIKSKKVIKRFYHKSNNFYGKDKLIVQFTNVVSKIYINFFSTTTSLNINANVITAKKSDIIVISNNKLKNDVIDSSSKSVSHKKHNNIIDEHRYLTTSMNDIQDTTSLQNDVTNHKIISIVTSASLVEVNKDTIDMSKHIAHNKSPNIIEKPLLWPTIPVNSELATWNIKNMTLNQMYVNIKADSPSTNISSSVIENMNLSKLKIENKLNILKENVILKHPREGVYYVVPKKDICYEGSIIISAKFDNASKLNAEHVATLAYNVVEDPSITNMYFKSITDDQYKLVIENFYKYSKND